MTLQHVGIQVLTFAAAHTVNKVAKRPARLHLSAKVIKAHRLAAVLGVKLATDDLALSGVILIAHHARNLVTTHQAARLKEQDCVIILADGHLGIGRLALVLVAKPATNAPHALG